MSQIETFRYDDEIVRKFLLATIVWGVVGLLLGVIIATQLLFCETNLGPWFSFGRLRPLHTNAVIFAVVGNGMFAGIYHSMQRLCKARMFSDALSNINFWGWQLIIVAAAVTLPLGITVSKEYAELEWPIDIAITLVWVVFAINFFGTLLVRRERHIYVAIWFYMATVITVALLHIVNSLELPVTFLKSYSIYAGVQDALVQWWYGHNAVALFSHHSGPRADVLLHAESSQPSGLFLPPFSDPFLGADFSLHLGRSASPALHRASGLGTDPGDGFQSDADCPFVGWNDQRTADPAVGLGKTADRSHAEIPRGRYFLLRNVNLRRPDAFHQIRQRHGFEIIVVLKIKVETVEDGGLLGVLGRLLVLLVLRRGLGGLVRDAAPLVVREGLGEGGLGAEVEDVNKSREYYDKSAGEKKSTPASAASSKSTRSTVQNEMDRRNTLREHAPM